MNLAIQYLTNRLKEKEQTLAGKKMTRQDKEDIRYHIECIKSAIEELQMEEQAVA